MSSCHLMFFFQILLENPWQNTEFNTENTEFNTENLIFSGQMVNCHSALSKGLCNFAALS